MRSAHLATILLVATSCLSAADGDAKVAQPHGPLLTVIGAPPPELPPRAPSGAATVADPSSQRPPKRLDPTPNGVCRFEERDPADRPSGLVQTNFHSNMIFWADRGAALWDHPNGFTNEGMVIPGKRIIAAREGRPDLWISPARNGHIMLFSGPDRFECVPRTAD